MSKEKLVKGVRPTIVQYFVCSGILLIGIITFLSSCTNQNATPNVPTYTSLPRSTATTQLSTATATHELSATATPSLLSSMLSSSNPCSGPTVYLSGQTTSRYKNNEVANGTTFDRTGWYSDAVGNGSDTAFTVGNQNPAPLDVCILGGVINGHLPLSYTWQDSHDFGGSGDRTYTSHIAHIDGARVHNVEDGWQPRELPELSNVGIMQMRNTYMTGIRDDAIENDNFMPGFIEDSLFDGVFTFLSEQNENGSSAITIGPNEDHYIRITRVYARIYPTSSDGYNLYSGRWFKWKPEGATNHNLIITDSVFAAGPAIGRWSVLDFPPGTTFQGTNYILWLGTPGQYEATVPPGVILLEGQPALDKWNQVRNNWLMAHGYSPRPANDLNPMDDPVVAPAIISISGNVGAAGVALNYFDGTPKTVISQADGSYSLPVSLGWSGTVTPSSACYTFNPASGSYSNVTTKLTGQNYTAISPSKADVRVEIAGQENGSYVLSPDATTSQNYYGVDAGPVRVVSANCVPIVAGLRDLWWNGSEYTSSIQLMGLPESQLSDSYIFPSYNNVSLNDQLRFGNVGSAATTVTVTIGGVVMGTYNLLPGQRQKANYAGVDSGPVIVSSSNGVPIIASIRDAWVSNGTTSSFSQLMGLPQASLADTYIFPSYNTVSVNDQLRFGNVGNANTTVTVTIAGQIMGTYDLGPNQREKVNYPGLDSGPVVVKSSNGVQIIASLRESWNLSDVTTSYFQMMGLPKSQLSDKYVFPVYDNVNLSGQLRFANIGNATTTVIVTIGGQFVGSYDLAPNQLQKVSYPGLNDGPVVVQSSNGVRIIAALRDAWRVDGVTTSFSQLMGLPGGQISNVYVFPSYNNVTYDNQLRIGVP